MNDNEFLEIERNLSAALESFDWVSSAKICDELIERIDRSTELFSLNVSKRLLNGLRRKRRFEHMARVAEAIMRSGQIDALVKRQYAQSLIDQGLLSAAELVILEIENDAGAAKIEKLEALGLAGRVFKQKFVQLSANPGDRKQEYLGRAIRQYLSGYEFENNSYWHSINAVALLMRGERDGLSLNQKVDPRKMAEDISTFLARIEEESSDPPKPWEYATMMEAQIALGQFEEAFSSSINYISSTGVDAFEINSTLRQLIEIWQLRDDQPPGDNILPVLRSALLEREGGSLNLSKSEARSDALTLEGVFGDNAPKTIKWYKEGLARTNSIARIELADGKGIGTAGLFEARDFFPDIDETLLVTNSHVVSTNPADSGLPPNKVKANIQGVEEIFEIDKVVWSSPQTDLDVSFLSLKGKPKPIALPISDSVVEMDTPAPRVYVIGHPNGRDLEVSLNDSRMVGANERFVHYRTPTEPGSSGSPVFDQHGWAVVAVHHGGSDQLPRIDGTPGTYQANEGIAVSAIKGAIIEDYKNR